MFSQKKKDGLCLDPKFDLIGKTDDATHAPKGYEKIYYLYDQDFIEEQGQPLKLSENGLTEQEKKIGLEF